MLRVLFLLMYSSVRAVRLIRWQQTSHSQFVTFTCYHRYEYLSETAACTVVLQRIENARLRYQIGS